MIQLKQISKEYHADEQSHLVLKGIDLMIDSGEFVAIMGPSGSGKSTLMNIVGCLDYPTVGEYQLDGMSISAMNQKELAQIRREKLGFVFQGFNLLPRRTIIENITLPLIYTRIPTEEAIVRAEALLELIGLKGYEKRKPAQLSGGQQQRVAIARALINQPKVILADEPTGNLDTETSKDVMAIFSELNRRHGITIVLITHEPDVANCAKRIIHIRDGIISSDHAPLRSA